MVSPCVSDVQAPSCPPHMPCPCKSAGRAAVALTQHQKVWVHTAPLGALHHLLSRCPLSKPSLISKKCSKHI